MSRCAYTPHLCCARSAHRSGVPVLGQVVLSDNSTAVRRLGHVPGIDRRQGPPGWEYWPRSSMTRSRGAHSGGGVAGRPTAGSGDGSPASSGRPEFRSVGYGGHGRVCPRTSSEGRAVPYHPDYRHSARFAALLIGAHGHSRTSSLSCRGPRPKPPDICFVFPVDRGR